MVSFFQFGFSTFILIILTVNASAAGGGSFTIPPLKKIIPLALEIETNGHRSQNEVKYQVQDRYYQIQYKTNQLGVAEEVKKRFGTAIEKAEERYDKGEGEVSQSDITKLKLGLSGSLNDIIELEKEILINKLALAGLTGLDFTNESELEEDTIQPVQFPKQKFDKIFGEKYSFPLFHLKKALLKVEESRSKMNLAQGSRKITRALLITEVANYDFGIGDSGDLFQALIIYTRVLSGYYETVYNFNIAVAGLKREIGKKNDPVLQEGRKTSSQ
jgi:Outer membrane efflux protein